MPRSSKHKVDAIDTYSLHTIIDIRPTACIIFNGDAHIGHGAILSVQSGTLTLGKNFAISGNTCIICNKYIEIGENVQFSWNSLVMDNDAHYILDVDGTEPSKESTLYSTPVSVQTAEANKTIKAIAVKEGMTDSEVLSITYTNSNETLQTDKTSTKSNKTVTK